MKTQGCSHGAATCRPSLLRWPLSTSAVPNGGIPIRIDGAKAVVPVDDAHRIDSGCTRRFPFRSFAKGTVGEKSSPFALAGRDGFVYQLEVIPADAGPQPHLQFYDGESPIPVPTAGTWFGNGLSVKA